eukprot:COSAG06_NODE_71_length_25945_cov_9.124468_30_plen_335_part_00
MSPSLSLRWLPFVSSCFSNKQPIGRSCTLSLTGHGAEQDGKHYLIPQEFPDKEDLEDDAIEQQQTLERIKRKNPLVTLAILDCCRENADVRAGYGGGEGLTGLAGPVGSLVMYATGAGGYAKDGLAGGEHGVFTDALLKVLDQPGLNLVQMCATVQKEVESATGGEQKPDFQAGGGMMEMVELQKISLVAKDHEPAPEPAAVPDALGSPPTSTAPRPINTLADLAATCDGVGDTKELLDLSPEELQELMKEMKVGVIGRKHIVQEHALEVERLPAGEAGARAREQLVRTRATCLSDSCSLLRCLDLPHALRFQSFLAQCMLSALPCCIFLRLLR